MLVLELVDRCQSVHRHNQKPFNLVIRSAICKVYRVRQRNKKKNDVRGKIRRV